MSQTTEMVCQVKMYNAKPCYLKIWDTEDQKCIFHSSKVDQKKESFSIELDRYIKQRRFVYDFTSFIFPAVSLNGKSFNDPVFFNRSVFHGEADLSNTEFSFDADFRDAEFLNIVNFDKCKFHHSAYFSRVGFHFAKFSSAKFMGEVDFFRAEFINMADFSGAEFHDIATFAEALFQEDVDFQFSTFYNQAYFIGFNEYKCFNRELNFSRIFLEKDAVIYFEKVNLTKSTLLDTNVEQVIFRDVEWHKPDKIWMRRKQALWDEFRPLDKEENRDFEKIAENYRQLVLNYERKRDYETAENFHIGEMEMRRKKKGSDTKNKLGRGIKECVNSYTLYKVLSYYGTSYWQSFFVLLFFLGLFSAFFLYAGFEPSEKTTAGLSGIIEYNISSDTEHKPVSFGQWLGDYREAGLLTLSIITFQRERFYEPVGHYSRCWLFVSVIVLTGQAAMVLLAIRRRFRR